MDIRFWGTRGSLAKPGRITLRHGGNTSCVEVRGDDGTLIVLDCGTGAHGLGQALLSAGPRCDGHLMITHTGTLGGVGAGKSSPTLDLGMIGNIVSGLVGDGVLGQIVTALLPSIMAAAQSGDRIGGIISQAIAGGAGGAMLTAIIGAIKNKAFA